MPALILFKPRVSLLANQQKASLEVERVSDTHQLVRNGKLFACKSGVYCVAISSVNGRFWHVYKDDYHDWATISTEQL